MVRKRIGTAGNPEDLTPFARRRDGGPPRAGGHELRQPGHPTQLGKQVNDRHGTTVTARRSSGCRVVPLWTTPRPRCGDAPARSPASVGGKERLFPLTGNGRWEERAAILAGAWARLDAIAPRKAACLLLIDAGATTRDAGQLAGLAAGLRRNQALLLAAIEGVRDAGLRGAALRRARAGLSTYDRAGARRSAGALPRVERRA